MRIEIQNEKDSDRETKIDRDREKKIKKAIGKNENIMALAM